MNKDLSFFLEDEEIDEVNELGHEDPKVFTDLDLQRMVAALDRAIYPNVNKLKTKLRTYLKNNNFVNRFNQGMNLNYNLLAILDKLITTEDPLQRQQFIRDLNLLFSLIAKTDTVLATIAEKYQTQHFKSI